MGMPGITELIIILAIVFLLFGAKRLPDLAKGLGKSITNFKSGLNEEQPDETETTAQQEAEPPPKEKEKNG
jgi:sec-independent protein translocase protein TatA